MGEILATAVVLFWIYWAAEMLRQAVVGTFVGVSRWIGRRKYRKALKIWRRLPTIEAWRNPTENQNPHIQILRGKKF